MKPKPLNKVVSQLLGYWLLGPIFFCLIIIIGVSIYFSVEFIQQRPTNHQLYIAILTLILLHISVITICVLTVKKLQGWFRQYIIQPIAQLSRGTEALIANNFQQSQATLDAPIKVSEINTLRTNIQYLSQTLQARQEALRESQERIQWRNKQLEILHKVGLEIVTELDLNARLKAIVTQAIEITNGASGGLYLYHSESNVLEWMTGAGGGNPPKGSILHKGEGLSGKVWETNTPLIINDYDNWEGRIKNYTIPGYHPCVVGVPLHWATQFLGVLVVTGNAPNTFTQETVDVLQLFTSQAASAINNAQLFAQVQTEREHISLLYQASQLLSNATSMREVATAALEIAPLLKAEDGSLILLDFYGQPLFYSTAEKHNALSLKQIKEFLTQITTGGLESWILENREPALITDIENDPRWLRIPEFEPRPIHAAICAPLVNYRNEIFGFLLYSHSQPGIFGNRQVEQVSEIATRVALAMENAQLYELEQLKRQEAEILRQAAFAISAAQDEETLVESLLEQLQEVVAYDDAAIQLLKGDELEVIGGWGIPQLRQGFKTGTCYPLHKNTPNREVYLSHATIIAQDAPNEYSDFVLSSEKGIVRSWIGVPMLIGDRLTGILALGKQEPYYFNKSHTEMLEPIAAQVAIAIEKMRLFKEERRQRELAHALQEAAKVLSSTLDLEQVLDHILEQVERVVPSDACNIMLIKDGIAHAVRWRGYKELGAETLIENFKIAITGYNNLRKMQQGQSVTSLDTTQDDEWVTLPGWEWLKSYLGIPIMLRGEIVGTLNVDGTQPNQFNPDDVKQLEAFASHAAAAIENAQLFQELQSYAQDLETQIEERANLLITQYAQQETILHSISDGIVVTNGKGKILQANTVAEYWLSTQCITDGTRQRLRETIHQLALQATDKPEQIIELPEIGLDIQLRAAPIKQPTGEQSTVVVLHDVSHLRKLDRMKSRFVTNVSHELRTPATTIKLYASLLQRGCKERFEEYLTALNHEATHLNQLVEGILEISKMDSGHFEVQPRLLPLSTLIETAVAKHQILADTQGITLEYKPVEPDLLVNVDPERITQAFNNLIKNALCYTLKGGKVSITTTSSIKGGQSWVKVDITDTGIGVPEEDLLQIFERFYRGSGPKQLEVPGTGLGLAITKEILKLHDGHITVASQVDKGSTFTLWLPQVKTAMEH